MAARRRLDAELVRRGIARSRAHAAELIGDGHITVNKLKASKPATNVNPADPIEYVGARNDFVSRGAHKLQGALKDFAHLGVEPRSQVCLDAGASTGGFTDVLLRQGAKRVAAVDVGYGQLAWRLRNDDRVDVFERTNIRDLSSERIGGQVGLTVGDLSFISLRLVLPALSECTADDGFMLPMVKPQFEVGRDLVGPKGVVRKPQLRADAVLSVKLAASQLGWQVADVAASTLPGPSGNVEFFCALRRDIAGMRDDDVRDKVISASEQLHMQGD